MSRVRVVFAVCGWIVGSTLTLPVAAVDYPPSLSEADLPFHSEIAADHIGFTVDQADIVISCDQVEQATLDIRAADPAQGGTADLEIKQAGPSAAVIDRHDSDDPLRLVFEIVVPPEAAVDVRGADLTIRRECDPIEQDDTGVAPNGTQPPAPLSQFDLKGGSLDYRGPGNVDVHGDDADLAFADTNGTITVASTGGTLALDTQRGAVKIEASRLSTKINDLAGTLNADLSGGDLSVGGSTATIVLSGSEAALDIRDSKGQLASSGTLNDLVVSNSSLSQLKLAGTDSTFGITGCGGNGSLNLTRGRATIDGWTGRMSLQAASGTELDISQIDGDFQLTVSDDVSGSVDGVTGHTRATVGSSQLSLSHLKSIDLIATSSSVTVTDTREWTSMSVTDGDLTASTTVLWGEPHLRLEGSATADLKVPAPCGVQVQGPGAASADIDVQGCDVSRQGTRPARRRKLRWETRRPVVLVIFVAATAELRVDGTVL